MKMKLKSTTFLVMFLLFNWISCEETADCSCNTAHNGKCWTVKNPTPWESSWCYVSQQSGCKDRTSWSKTPRKVYFSQDACKGNMLTKQQKQGKRFISLMDQMTRKLGNFTKDCSCNSKCWNITDPTPSVPWCYVDRNSTCPDIDIAQKFKTSNTVFFSYKACQGSTHVLHVSPNVTPYVIAILVVLLVLLVFVIVWCLNHKAKNYKQFIPTFLNISFKEMKSASDRNSEQQQIIENLPEWAKQFYEPIEILRVGEEIGKGSFGVVYKGELQMNEDIIEVAVKTSVNKPFAKEELLSEGELMSKLKFHHNIINLLGVSVDVPQNQNRFLLITEFCSEGGLLEKLGQMRKDQENAETNENNELKKEDAEKLVGWSYQIALGMEFLSQTNTIHGDLAARNILLDGDDTAKIGDFGKAHSVNYANIAVEVVGAQPLLWMAPEAIDGREITLDSDKWSYGVTIWEVFSLGVHPYSIIRTNATDRTSNLKTDLKKGYRMPQPEWCPTKVYKEVILPCWNLDPDQRPGWSELVQLLSNLVDGEYLQNYDILASNNRRIYQDIKNFDNDSISFYV